VIRQPQRPGTVLRAESAASSEQPNGEYDTNDDKYDD
jgi:hypothetical protein